MSTDGTPARDFRFQVAPRNGRAERLVIALDGDQPIHRDLLNPDTDRDRQRFIHRLEEILQVPAGTLASLAADLVAAADQANEILDQARAAHAESPAGQKSQASRLVDVIDDIENIELFHDVEGLAYARFPVNAHRETCELRRKGFRRWLVREFFQRFGSVPGSQAVQDALGVLEAKAIFDGPEHDVHVRYAQVGETIYVDLCDPDWRVVEITATEWIIQADSPIYFRRSRGMLPLPTPQSGGSPDDLRQFLNISGCLALALSVVSCGNTTDRPVSGVVFDGRAWRMQEHCVEML